MDIFRHYCSVYHHLAARARARRDFDLVFYGERWQRRSISICPRCLRITSNKRTLSRNRPLFFSLSLFCFCWGKYVTQAEELTLLPLLTNSKPDQRRASSLIVFTQSVARSECPYDCDLCVADLRFRSLLHEKLEALSFDRT